MRSHASAVARVTRKRLAPVLACFAVASAVVEACTIFVLTDTNRALFCNNEDWLNPKTRIWFVPGGDGHYGCAYVGFDDGWPQGGLNTKGLAFDWVAGFIDEWKPGPEMKAVRGNPSQRMLETCATVEDAIAFYRTYQEFGFFRARILVADRTGASVIVGAKEGRLLVEEASQSRGFGYGRRTLDKMLAESCEPNVTNGAKILRACLQDGETATKYSNVFDLRTGDMFFYQFPEQAEAVKLNLAVELEKGGHYYDLPQLREQFTQGPRPLLNNMKRFFLDEFKPIPDKEPRVTERFRSILRDASGGSLKADDYTAELWKELSPKQAEMQADLKRLGKLLSMTLVGRWDEDGQRSYRYRTEFENATLLQRLVLDGQNRIALIRSESVETKPGAGVGSDR